VIFQGFLILGLLRQVSNLEQLVSSGRFREANGGALPVGSVAPQFLGLDESSHQQLSSSSLRGRGGVILFLSSQCQVCNNLVESLDSTRVEEIPSLIILCTGKRDSSALFLKPLKGRVPCLLENVDEVVDLYHISAFPTAVVVDGDLKIRQYGHPHDLDTLRALANTELHGSGDQNSLVERTGTRLVSSEELQ
jgi:hypothetical protein